MHLASAPGDDLEIPNSLLFLSVRLYFGNGQVLDIGHEILNTDGDAARAEALEVKPGDWDDFADARILTWLEDPKNEGFLEDNGDPTSSVMQVSDLPSAEHTALLVGLLDKSGQPLN